MKVNSISGITCQVEDLARAADFYETIGFPRGKEESDRVTFYIKVDDVEDFHKAEDPDGYNLMFFQQK